MSVRRRTVRHVGAHVSIAGGVETAPARGEEIGANALGIFTRNQRQWHAPDLTEEQTSAFTSALEHSGIPPEQVLVHASYLINAGNPDPEKWRRAVDALREEALRVEALGLTLLNFHPGSGLGTASEEETVSRIADAVAEVIDSTTTAVLVLETTAGQGAHLGHTFEQLAAIMRAAGDPERVGACIDTCHILAAGYDIRTPAGYRDTVRSFADTVGMARLRGVHLNDSQGTVGSRKDRHANLGAGELGLAALARVIADPELPDVPFILETPKPELWGREIALLRGFADGSVDPRTATPPVLDQEEQGDDPG